jgi:hypothetical protein
MTEAQKGRLKDIGLTTLGLFLLVGLVLLIWQAFLLGPIPQQRVITTVTQVVLPPPPPSPGPQQNAVRRRVDSVAMTVPVPKPNPEPPKPQAHRRITSKALAEPLSSVPNQYNIPQGTDEGIVIGGDGGDGGGVGCGGGDYFLTLITSQLQSILMRNERTDSRTFHIKAEVWFDSAGSLRRSLLIQSTGDASLDAKVRHLLDGINVGADIPQCLQPITVWVSEPWQVELSGTREIQTYRTEMPQNHFSSWQRQRPR